MLAPWPNRIGDGRYEFEGQSHQRPINEVDRRTALHGLVAVDGWHARSHTAESVTLGVTVWPRTGYPFLLDPVMRPKVASTAFDYTGGRPLDGLVVDHALTWCTWDEPGRASATVLGSDGGGVRLTWDRARPRVQVHTGDRPEPRLHRSGLAVEPMTCPSDAFRTGEALLVLQPGQSQRAWWQIAAVRPADEEH